jgi:hypothetical protein
MIDIGLRVSLSRRVSEQPTLPPPNLWVVKSDPLTRYQFTTAEVYANGVRLMRTADQLGAPAVFRTGSFEDHKSFSRTRFTREYQFMAADLLSLRKYNVRYSYLEGDERADILRAFNSLYDSSTAFTNIKGVDNCNNYLTNSDRGEDPRIDPLICAGSVVEVLQVATNSKGVQMARLRSYRAPSVPMLADTRVMKASIIYKSDGRLGEFPQLGGLAVNYPLISSHDIWYPIQDLARLEER